MPRKIEGKKRRHAIDCQCRVCLCFRGTKSLTNVCTRCEDGYHDGLNRREYFLTDNFPTQLGVEKT